MDSFIFRIRKQARHCGYRDEELEFVVRDQLLFEVPNKQLAAVLTAARAWETARRQAKVIAGGEEKSSVNLLQHRESKETSGGKPHTSAMHVGGQGILRVTRCVLREVRRVQSVEGRGTGQYAVGMRRIESRARVVGELVGVIVSEKTALDANHH